MHSDALNTVGILDLDRLGSDVYDRPSNDFTAGPGVGDAYNQDADSAYSQSIYSEASFVRGLKRQGRIPNDTKLHVIESGTINDTPIINKRDIGGLNETNGVEADEDGGDVIEAVEDNDSGTVRRNMTLNQSSEVGKEVEIKQIKQKAGQLEN